MDSMCKTGAFEHRHWPFAHMSDCLGSRIYPGMAVGVHLRKALGKREHATDVQPVPALGAHMVPSGAVARAVPARLLLSPCLLSA